MASSSNEVAVVVTGSTLTSGVPRLLLSYERDKKILDSTLPEGGSSLKGINMVIDRKGREDP